MMLEVLKNVVSVAKQLEVNAIIVENDVIRGINDGRTSAIFTKVDLPLECSIGINRIDVLLSRLSLSDDLTLEVGNIKEYHNVKDNTKINYAENLILKNSKMTVEYRTAIPSKITAPKSLKVEDVYTIDISKDLHKFLTKSKSAMKADAITILCNNNQVTYRLNDDSNDRLEYKDGIAQHLNDSLEDINFIYRYSIKSLLNAFAKCDETIIINEKGMIHFIINTIDVFLLPLK